MLEFLKQNAKFIMIAATLAASAYLGYSNGYDKADSKWKETVHNEYIKQSDANRITQEKLNDISGDYQEELAQGETDAARRVDAVYQSGKRMRVKLNLTEAQLSHCGFELDGKAELHRETSEALIRITQDADKHVEALQKTVRALQGKEAK